MIEKPKYCPGCGEEFKKHSEDNPTPTMGYLDNNDLTKTKGYDCYCDKCKWSGNIEPFEE